MSSSSSSDKCIGKSCRGVVNSTPQLNDLITGDNPDIVKASNCLVACPTCKSFTSDPKEKMITVLASQGINTLPRGGVDAIRFEPKNVRYSHKGRCWEFRCGYDTQYWYRECTKPRCLGTAKLDLPDVAGKLYHAIRSPAGSPDADLKPVFEMCEHCGYGHPAACGEAQFVEKQKQFILSIMKPCIHGDRCHNATTTCSLYHGKAEKKKVEERLTAYVNSVIDKIKPTTSWGANGSPLVIGAAAEIVPKTFAAKASEFPAMASSAGAKASAIVPKLAPEPVSHPEPTAVRPEVPVEDDSVSIDDIRTMYLASLRKRLARNKESRAKMSNEIAKMNKTIESYRAEIDRLDIEMTNTVRHLAAENEVGKKMVEPTVEVSSSASSVSVVKSVSKKKKQKKEESASKADSPKPSATASLPILQESPSLEEADPIVKVDLDADADDSLSGRMVILPEVNAEPAEVKASA